MEKLELINILEQMDEEEVFIEINGTLYDIEIGQVEEAFDGFDTVYPACISLKAKKGDRGVMKIAKYTLYVEIYEDGVTTEELQEQIKDKVLNQCALNGNCLLVENASKVIDTSDWTVEQLDNRPLNFYENIVNPDIWEQELKREHEKWSECRHYQEVKWGRSANRRCRNKHHCTSFCNYYRSPQDCPEYEPK